MPIPKYTANIGQQSISINAGSLAAAFGAGSEFALSIPNQGTPNITWQTVFAGGNPGTITVVLEASLDGLNWSPIDTSTSVAGEVRTVSGSFRFLRINNSAVTVGAGITLTASFVQSNGLYVPSSLLWTPTFSLTQAQILALNATPITIAAAIPGYIYWPIITQLTKPVQTTGYTIGGGSLFQLGWENLAGLAFFSIANAAFLDQTTIQNRGGNGMFNNAGTEFTNLNLDTQAKPNVPLVAKITVAAVTGGSADAIIRGRVAYYLLPGTV